MHDELLQNPGMLHREALPAHAASIGLDLGRFASDLDDPTLVARVERDVASGRASSVNATPTFFLDGARYANSRNLDGLRDAIFEATIRSVQRRG
jgi:predicted DsbA family dithiol-disulfide isomerase